MCEINKSFKRGVPLIIISQYWLFLIIDISFLSKSVIGAITSWMIDWILNQVHLVSMHDYFFHAPALISVVVDF